MILEIFKTIDGLNNKDSPGYAIERMVSFPATFLITLWVYFMIKRYGCK